MTTQYFSAEFYPAKKTGIESLGPGTKNTYILELHDMPSMQRAVAPYVAARNPYASSCVTHMLHQKVSHYLNTASTGEFVSMHRWSTSPPALDTNSVSNLMDGIDFDAPFLLDSTGDTSNKDTFLYHNNFFP
eukprot:13616219-Ditylum_brightwellii.AAC.1